MPSGQGAAPSPNGTPAPHWEGRPSSPEHMVDNPAEFVNGTLEVDPNATSADIADFIEVDDDDENDNAASLYAISTYPRVPSEYLVEEPFECAVDGSSVMCVLLLPGNGRGRPLELVLLLTAHPPLAVTRPGRYTPTMSTTSWRMAGSTAATTLCPSTRPNRRANT